MMDEMERKFRAKKACSFLNLRTSNMAQLSYPCPVSGHILSDDQLSSVCLMG